MYRMPLFTAAALLLAAACGVAGEVGPADEPNGFSVVLRWVYDTFIYLVYATLVGALVVWFVRRRRRRAAKRHPGTPEPTEAKAELGRTGRIACVLNLLGLLVGGAVLLGLVLSVELGVIVAAVAPAVLAYLTALILSIAGRGADDPPARSLRTSISLLSLTMAAVLITPFLILTLGVETAGHSSCMHGIVFVLIGGVVVVTLSIGSVASTVAWVRAVRGGVGPRWAVAMTLLPLLPGDLSALAGLIGLATWPLVRSLGG